MWYFIKALRYGRPTREKRKAFALRPRRWKAVFEGAKSVNPWPDFWDVVFRCSSREVSRRAGFRVENLVGRSVRRWRAGGGGMRMESSAWMRPLDAL